MTPHFADQICLLAAAIVPVPLIIAFRGIGLILGTLAVWGILLFAGYWISSLDPSREGAMVDSIWLLGGWIGGLLYCLPILGVRELVAYVLRKRRKTVEVHG